VFNPNGAVLSGPAPAPLAWWELTLSRDGHLVIDTSQPIKADKYLVV
jgi:Rieske Fe-S protein